ncbi:MAG: hydrogenase accessory protein HypB [Anaerolineae bacterium]|nr:MAG: hydrogenase accessory protein HypB [Anaerolineae bacterium]
MTKISVQEEIFNANDQVAAQNRALLDAHGIFAINVMASPGAGKTSLIERTLQTLGKTYRVLVIDGDIAPIDVERAAAAGAHAVQINTGGNCHLDAPMLHEALRGISLEAFDLLIVENVGNLICPAEFALGTHRNVLVASVPEGDDKPYKYPAMYRGVHALVLNKIDLLPYIPFRMEYFQRGVQALNPGLHTFPLSCQTGEGLSAWLDWLHAGIASIKAP